MNPKSLDIAALPSVPLEGRNLLPEEPCVYLAINAHGQVQYIGRSVNPRKRWQQHHRQKMLDAMEGVRIAYLFCDEALLDEIEAALIEWFDPYLNGLGAGRPGGNPDIAQHGFKPKYDWGESCDLKMTLRVPESMQSMIKAAKLEAWPEIARVAIAKALLELPREQVSEEYWPVLEDWAKVVED